MNNTSTLDTTIKYLIETRRFSVQLFLYSSDVTALILIMHLIFCFCFLLLLPFLFVGFFPQLYHNTNNLCNMCKHTANAAHVNAKANS